MHITLPKRVLEVMTQRELDIIGYDRRDRHGIDKVSISLVSMSNDDIRDLRAGLVRMDEEGVRGLKVKIADIDRWCKIVEEGGAGQARPRSLRQFSDVLTEYFRLVPGHRVYEKTNSGEHLAYYINTIEYQAESRMRGDYTPAHVTIGMVYRQWGEDEHHSEALENKDVEGRTVVEALADMGLFAETDDLRAAYLKSQERFDEVFPQVGRQYTTSGMGIGLGRRAWGQPLRTPMAHEGVPGKVVVDVVEEEGDEKTGRKRGWLNQGFWRHKKPKSIKRETSDDLMVDEDDDSGYGADQPIAAPPEIPIHPYVPVYHLFRHARFQVHVMDLDDYEYNKDLGEQLILPAITKNLVNVLIGQGKVSFQDIIAGKGAGAAVLLGGPPGVGKTLTAEVFAEATERPLLTVQAAQLGINAEQIEKKLRTVLTRGSRWNAVVLLDEADVYIGERGTDLYQNAIVAAFLRILEYHTSTIFMTTNRMDTVDDAIASRCLARIDYEKPTRENQVRIWWLLNRLNDAGLSNQDIEDVVDRMPNCSGRDIKQLLKLAQLWCESEGKPVTPTDIQFVERFLSTGPTKGAI